MSQPREKEGAVEITEPGELVRTIDCTGCRDMIRMGEYRPTYSFPTRFPVTLFMFLCMVVRMFSVDEGACR